MSRGPDAATLLLRALQRDAARAGCDITVAHATAQRWASATFSGYRHTLSIAARESPALNDWVDGLPESELDVRGHVLADLAVVALRREAAGLEIDIEALTVED